ncbi:hypothetical protein JMJ55_15150 [Belnapia sp. T6]|uniref:Glycoside hydrolase family 5 domain-containing protein n=1 Tax=Belnapia mucosa TaxID=2804532 RepID=A0ABS1V4Q0_9PROT|nr:hypothetical protein [Belnapia mucosa]MBL6456671.1 hypothetical protein [Belnapia mucosa]
MAGALLACAAAQAQPAPPPNRLLAILGGAGGGEAGGLGSGFGVNIHFTAGRRQDLERIRALGMRVVRTDLLWASVETQAGLYDWSRTDALLADAEAAGLIPLLILAYSNPLYVAREPGRPDTPSMAWAAPVTGPARDAYLAFVEAAVARYRGRAIWEVWNEPDINFGQPVNRPAYIELAQQACQRIRALEPAAAVLGPASASLGSPFLRDFAAADRAGCFDGLSVHPYREEAPEGVLADWVRLRGLIARHRPPGPDRVPLLPVAGEWGYASVGGAGAEQRQADYALRIPLLSLVAGIPLTILYDWQNDGPDPDDREANFGLVDFHGAPKPAHAALAGLQDGLKGLRYLGRVSTRRPADFVLAFGRGKQAEALVAWTTSSMPAERVAIEEGACLEPPPAGPAAADTGCRPEGLGGLSGRLPRLTASPVVVALPLRGPD